MFRVLLSNGAVDLGHFVIDSHWFGFSYSRLESWGRVVCMFYVLSNRVYPCLIKIKKKKIDLINSLDLSY